MLSVVQCDSLISLKGAFHNEGSIGAKMRENLENSPHSVVYFSERATRSKCSRTFI